MVTEAQAESAVDQFIDAYQTTEIKYYPYVAGTPNKYKQNTKGFGTAVTVVGRAIHNPTPEQVTIIGNGEEYEIGFLFSRLEMVRKFPSGTEGEWISDTGQMEWRNRRYKLEKVQPTAQVGEKFLLMVALGKSIQGSRDS
jgi:hypothetical protein